MKQLPTISSIIPELDKICAEFKLENKGSCYRNTLSGEHGYFKAWDIWKERNGFTNKPVKPRHVLLLATVAKHNTKKLS